MSKSILEDHSIGPLEGKRALVTGGGRGVGAAISRRLAAAGARVVIVGRDKATLESHASKLPNEPVTIVADLANPAVPLAVLEQARDIVGEIDVVINNAGTGWVGASTFTPEDYEQIFAVNTRATLLLAGHAAASMARNGGGSIVNISSGLSTLGVSGHSLYSAAKGAVDSATRALAAEWGSAGVRVNTVRLGVTRTEMSAPIWTDEEILSGYLDKVPLNRIGEPEEIAEAVLFLSSPAASYVTGQLIGVDGGWEETAPMMFSTS